MAILRTRRVEWLLVGAALISSCHVAAHYSGWQYRGGQLIDNGLFSRPRYEARFAGIPFNVPGTYSYSFSRFPATDAVVMLATPSEPPKESIEKLTTQLRLRVMNQDGRILCDGTGSPLGTGHTRVVVTSSTGVIGLWHTSCVALHLRSCSPCRLFVSVDPVDPATPNLVLVPTMQGGGVELP